MVSAVRGWREWCAPDPRWQAHTGSAAARGACWLIWEKLPDTRAPWEKGAADYGAHYCHTPFRERRNEASIRVPRMFKSHV
jgi:hypothetical protein